LKTFGQKDGPPRLTRLRSMVMLVVV